MLRRKLSIVTEAPRCLLISILPFFLRVRTSIAKACDPLEKCKYLPASPQLWSIFFWEPSLQGNWHIPFVSFPPIFFLLPETRRSIMDHALKGHILEMLEKKDWKSLSPRQLGRHHTRPGKLASELLCEKKSIYIFHHFYAVTMLGSLP